MRLCWFILIILLLFGSFVLGTKPEIAPEQAFIRCMGSVSDLQNHEEYNTLQEIRKVDSGFTSVNLRKGIISENTKSVICRFAKNKDCTSCLEEVALGYKKSYLASSIHNITLLFLIGFSIIFIVLLVITIIRRMVHKMIKLIILGVMFLLVFFIVLFFFSPSSYNFFYNFASFWYS